MLLFLVSFVVLLLPSAGNYADHLGLQCSPVFSVEKPKLKKTKVWKKCHDSNKQLLTCLEEGFSVKDIGVLVDKDELLCEYISSRDHIVRYTDRVDAEKASVTKKYQKGKEFKGVVEDMKRAFITVTSSNRSAPIVDALRMEINEAMAEIRTQSQVNLTVMIESMANLSISFGDKVQRKSLNILLDYEDLALDAKNAKPPVHMSMKLNEIHSWTSKNLNSLPLTSSSTNSFPLHSATPPNRPLKDYRGPSFPWVPYDYEFKN